METNAYTSMTCTARLRVAASSQDSGLTWGIAQLELMRTSTPSGFRAAHAAPVYVAAKGTTVSATATTRVARRRIAGRRVARRRRERPAVPELSVALRARLPPARKLCSALKQICGKSSATR